MALNHNFSSVVPDNPAAVAAGKVVASGWNAEHIVVGEANAVLFNDGGLVGTDADLWFDKTAGTVHIDRGSLQVAGGLFVGVDIGCFGKLGAPTVQVGFAGFANGVLEFANVASSYSTSFQAGNALASVTYTLPTNVGAAGSALVDAAGDGVLSWGAALARPAGADTQVQFNDGGVLSGDAGFVYDKTSDSLGVSGSLEVGGFIAASEIDAVSDMGVGIASATTGRMNFANAASAFFTRFQAGNALAEITYTLPTNVGASGSVLTDPVGDGTLAWAVPSAGTPAGSDTQVQFNDGGAFGGDSKFSYDKVTGTMNVVSAWLGVPFANTGELLFINASSAYLTKFQAGNALANVTYTLPTNKGAAGSALTDAAGDGTLSWAVPSSAPAGSNTQVQFNDGGAFGGDGQFTYDKTTGAINLSNNGGRNYFGPWLCFAYASVYFAGFNSAARCDNGGYIAHSSGIFGWNEPGQYAGPRDTGLARNTAGVVEINNGTTGQYRDLVARFLTATDIVQAGAHVIVGTTSRVNITSDGWFQANVAGGMQWANTIDGRDGPKDVELRRNAAGILEVTNASDRRSTLRINTLQTSFDTVFDDGRRAQFSSGGLRMGSDCAVVWANINLSDYSLDTGIQRNAPGVLEINNGTAGQYRDLKLRNINVQGLTASQFVKTDASKNLVSVADAFTLTTTGTSGAATYSSGTLNIPQYTGGAGGTPGGATTQVQFNDGGVFAGDAGFVYNKTLKNLALGVGAMRAWSDVGRIIDVDVCHIRGSSAIAELGANAYYNGGWLYKTTGAAVTMGLVIYGGNPSFTVNMAPSGAAGAAVPFVTALSIDVAGNMYPGGQIRTGAGSAAAPSHSFDTDTTTGMYSVAATYIGLSCGGVLQNRIQPNYFASQSAQIHAWFDPGITTHDIGISRWGAGTLQINDGLTSGQLRDLYCRHITNTGVINVSGLVTAGGGLQFPNAVGASATDFSKHINLYGGTYGFSITSGTLNLVAGAVAHSFTASGMTTGTINSAGITCTGLNTQGQVLYAGAVSCTTINTNGNLITASQLNASRVVAMGSTSTIAGGGSGNNFEQQSAGAGNAAYMAFHIPGAYAAFFGLDTDNTWKVGGWSMGAVSYPILHGGNSFSFYGGGHLDAGWRYITTTGSITTAATLTAKQHASPAFQYSAPAGNHILDWNNGTSQVWTVTGAINVWTRNTPAGSILRIICNTGGNTVSFQSGGGYDNLFWANGVTPPLTGGPIYWFVASFVKVDAYSVFGIYSGF